MAALHTAGSQASTAEAVPASASAQAMVDLLTSLAAEHSDRQHLIHDLTRSIERGNEQLRSAGLSPTF